MQNQKSYRVISKQALDPHPSLNLRATDRPTRSLRNLRNAFLAWILFVIATLMVRSPDLIDMSIVTALNNYGLRHPAVYQIMFWFDNDPAFSGAVLIAVLWGVWFGADTDNRARIIAGVLAAFPAGIVSRILQYRLTTHPRPIYSPDQNFHLPQKIAATSYNTWNSFPSDHATVYAGLVITIFVVRPRLGLILGLYLGLIESSRIFMGGHYPLDLVGGAALAGIVIWLMQERPVLALARNLLVVERIRPVCFYIVAMIVTYHIATLFSTVRNLTGGFAILHLVY